MSFLDALPVLSAGEALLLGSLGPLALGGLVFTFALLVARGGRHGVSP